MIQQVECTFLCGKEHLIPTRIQTEPQKNEGEGGQRRDNDQDLLNEEEDFQSVFTMCDRGCVISPEPVQMISNKFNLSEAQIGPLI